MPYSSKRSQLKHWTLMCFINSLNKNDTGSKSQPKMNIWRHIDGSEVESNFFLTLLEVPELKGQIMAMTTVKWQGAFVETRHSLISYKTTHRYWKKSNHYPEGFLWSTDDDLAQKLKYFSERTGNRKLAASKGSTWTSCSKQHPSL